MTNPDEVPVSLTEGSGSIVSRPGAGKTARVLIPTLLSDPDSHVVVDPSADAYQVVQGQRDRLASDGLVLCPFSEEARNSHLTNKGEN